jgi:hypothetical protein
MINNFAKNCETPSHVESSVLHHPEVHCASGFADATVADLEFDPVGLHPSTDDVEIVIGRGLFRPGIGCQDEIRGLAPRDKLDEHCGGINPDAVSEHHW